MDAPYPPRAVGNGETLDGFTARQRGLYFFVYLHNAVIMEIQKKAKAFNIRRFLLNFGKFVTDFTKLVFGSLVLGSVIKGEIPPYMLLTGGIIASAVGAVIGITIVSLCEEK